MEFLNTGEAEELLRELRVYNNFLLFSKIVKYYDIRLFSRRKNIKISLILEFINSNKHFSYADVIKKIIVFILKEKDTETAYFKSLGKINEFRLADSDKDTSIRVFQEKLKSFCSFYVFYEAIDKVNKIIDEEDYASFSEEADLLKRIDIDFSKLSKKIDLTVEKFSSRITNFKRIPFVMPDLIPNLETERFYLFQAPTKTGKSFFLLNLALHYFLKKKGRILYINLENSEQEVYFRMAGIITGKKWTSINREDVEKVEKLFRKIKKDNPDSAFVFYPNKLYTIEDLEEELSKNYYDLVIIDYIDKLKTANPPFNSPYLNLGFIIEKSFDIIGAHKSILITASQTNRKALKDAKEGKDFDPDAYSRTIAKLETPDVIITMKSGNAFKDTVDIDFKVEYSRYFKPGSTVKVPANFSIGRFYFDKAKKQIIVNV